jgi:hypothetical protein
MSDIKFNCAFCMQSLEAPVDMAGELIDCPQCQKSNEIPASPPRQLHESPRQGHRPQIKRATPPPSKPKKKTTTKQVLVYVGASIGSLIALFIAFMIFSPTKEDTRATQEPSQAQRELAARLIHEARHDELKAKWTSVNSLQQMGVGDADELRRAANNLERAMVIEFQKANPPEWIIQQQSEGIFEKSGGWSQYTFATTNEELIALMFKRVNETASEVARGFNREFSE